MKDVEVIQLLFERNEAVLERISREYGALYKGVISKILDNAADVSECENDVLLAVWNSIPPNRPQNFSAYVCKIARNLSVNKLKYNTRAKRSADYTVTIEELKNCIPDKLSENHSQAEERKIINRVLEEFLESLDSQTRILFIRRYFFLESVDALSKRFKMPKNRISVRLFRARKDLHKLLEKEEIAL